METLKMKFKLHALEFEIEGSQDVVKTEFKNFHDNILTPLIAKVNIAQTNLLPPDNANSETNTKEIRHVMPAQVVSNDYPTLKDVKLRDLPQSEPEWVVIYSFYASEHGSQEFTREDILRLYDSTDRKTESRSANLSNNIKSLVSSLLIKSTNDTNFIILPAGIEKAQDILAGKSTAKTSSKKTSRPISKAKDKPQEKDTSKQGNKSNSNNAIAFIDLKLKVNEMQSLKDYFSNKSPKSQNDQVAVAINWYTENKSDKGVTLEEINYLIKIATNKVPSALGQVLINMKGPKLNLVSKDEDGRYTLTSIGTLHVADLNK